MNDNLSDIERHEIKEQAGTPTIRFVIDGHTLILPYAFFVRAECHVQEGRCLIIGYWTTMTITIQGRNLEHMVQLLAEYRLLTVVLRTGITEEPGGAKPYLERILVSLREQGSSDGKKQRKGIKSLSESVGRP